MDAATRCGECHALPLQNAVHSTCSTRVSSTNGIFNYTEYNNGGCMNQMLRCKYPAGYSSSHVFMNPFNMLHTVHVYIPGCISFIHRMSGIIVVLLALLEDYENARNKRNLCQLKSLHCFIKVQFFAIKLNLRAISP